MARHSHVPKFGNWDTDDTPYTTYFENARQEKTGVRIKMNPNDPKENPEAFVYMKQGQNGNNTRPPIQAPPYRHHNHPRVNSNKASLMVARKYQVEGQTGQTRNKIDRQRSGSRKSMVSISSSDRSNSDHSLLKPSHRQSRSDMRKSISDGKNNSSALISTISRNRSGNPSDVPNQKVASVPKFGSWDESDPKSGESFTIIFNKVKEEKQIASTMFPTMLPVQTSRNSDNEKHKGISSTRSKICCCLF